MFVSRGLSSGPLCRALLMPPLARLIRPSLLINRQSRTVASASGDVGGPSADLVELYIGDIPSAMNREQIAELFAPFGKVTRINKPGKADRGFGFVKLPAASADAAIEKLNGYEVDGKAITVNVRKAVPKTAMLYVGNLDPAVTVEELQQLFTPIGSVQGVKLPPDTRKASTSRHAFVRVLDEEAEFVIKMLHDSQLAGRNIVVSRRRELPGKPSADAKQVSSAGAAKDAVPVERKRAPAVKASLLTASLYVGNLDPAVTEEELRQLFTPVGTVERVKLPPFKDTAEITSRYAFVDVPTAEVEHVISKLHDTQFGGRNLIVSKRQQGGAAAKQPGSDDKQAAAAKQGAETATLYIGNLDLATTEEELRKLFTPVATVERLRLPSTTVPGATWRYAFVKVPAAEAEHVIAKLHDTQVGGRNIIVAKSQTKADRLAPGSPSQQLQEQQ